MRCWTETKIDDNGKITLRGYTRKPNEPTENTETDEMSDFAGECNAFFELQLEVSENETMISVKRFKTGEEVSVTLSC